MECPECKSRIPDDSQFCLSCGHKFKQNPNPDPLDILATTHHLAPGTTIANRYRLTDYIGRGGMGIVFKALDEELEIEVAIKFLPPELVHDERSIKDLKREAKSAMLLSHPNIVRLHNFESREGLNFVIMEYINGPTLSKLLMEKERFTPEETLHFAKDICKGLAYAHKNYVIHRDIKPQNLMLHYLGKPSDFVIAHPSLVIASDREAISLETACMKQSRKGNLSGDWVLKIADFGIARVVSDTMSRVSQRPTTGTLVYMSPEQLRGREVDKRTDIYSLGCVLYEFLTGKPPFWTGDIYHQHLEEPPIPPKEKTHKIPENLNNLILNCLAKNPDERYQTIEELEKDIDKVTAGQTVKLLILSIKENLSSPPPVKRNIFKPLAWVTGIVIVAGLVTLGIGVYNHLQLQEEQKARSEEKARKEVEERQVLTQKSSKLQAEAEAKARKEQKLAAKRAEITNSIGMKFVLIKAGTFMMGSPSSEENRGSDETQHRVTLTNDFYMQTTEVTQGQYEEIMGNNPSYFKGRDLPVEQVSWNEAVEFCKKLSQKEGKEYRLPTEAEWEYACRAGTATPFYFGETISTDQANYNGNYTYGNGRKGVYRQKTIEVSSFPANSWGLYDMHGNVWEWCSDWHGEYPVRDVTDPEGPSSGGARVVRGGSWIYDPVNVRSADRYWYFPDFGYGYVGFRCARTP